MAWESAYNNTHNSLVQAGAQYNYTDVQDNAIAQLREENAALNKRIQEYEHETRMMVLEVSATKQEIKSKDNEIARVKKDLVDARRNRLSVSNQVQIQNNKADNAIHVSDQKEKAKVDSYEEKKQNDILRQQDSFQASRGNYRNNKGGQWNVMRDVSLKL